MKIDGTSLPAIGSIQGTKHLKPIEKKTVSSETDRIAVSDKAQLFQSLLQKAKEVPAVREEKVKALSAQIERGEYQVNSQKIAETLVSTDI